ncbi:MAG: hypothetical protein OXE52_04965 [Chloroflexi bacterium]|nr:hypothetical protein [Chloroflexota bacterium]
MGERRTFEEIEREAYAAGFTRLFQVYTSLGWLGGNEPRLRNPFFHGTFDTVEAVVKWRASFKAAGFNNPDTDIFVLERLSGDKERRRGIRYDRWLKKEGMDGKCQATLFS